MAGGGEGHRVERRSSTHRVLYHRSFVCQLENNSGEKGAKTGKGEKGNYFSTLGVLSRLSRLSSLSRNLLDTPVPFQLPVAALTNECAGKVPHTD
jgi:hypothetical protein